MANEEQLDILRSGVSVWNQFRSEHSTIAVDLSRADLVGEILYEANLAGAKLSGAILSGARLSRAILSGANLNGATLFKANLTGAHLYEANLTGADLTEADLSGANLSRANLSEATLAGARLSRAVMANTILGSINLSKVIGLDTLQHGGPSTLGIDTILLSGDSLPSTFLRGVGLPDPFIDYIPSLVGQPIQFYDCFISYSSVNEDFAKRLHADLQASGVRTWFAPEDMKIGDKILDTVDQAIRLRDKLLVVLSQHSIQSDWVEIEVNAAFPSSPR